MSPSEKIDEQINSLGDWRGERLKWFRELVHKTEPDITEDFKWGVGVFTYGGKLVCAMSGFKDHTKFNFFNGASLDDPDGIFNSGLDSKQHRSIDSTQTDQLDTDAIVAMIHRAVIYAAS